VASSLLIVNPFASNVTEDLVARVRDALPDQPEVRLTQAPGHAVELSRAAVASGTGAIYVFSGDGGFNEVLNGVDGSTVVGFIPGGGTSVLPRALGLPRDPVAAAQRFAAGRTRRISVGRINGRRFGFSAGLGFDAELVRRIDALGRTSDGRRPGDLAFTWSAVRAIAEQRARYHEVLTVDGLGRAALALIANCDPYSYVGSIPLHVAPSARFELGLDLVAPRSVRARDLPRLVGYLTRGKGQERSAGVIYAHDRDRLVIHCDRPLPLHVDGEDVGDVKEAVCEAERDAVSVLV